MLTERIVGLQNNRLYRGDCIERLAELDEGSIDLVFADPPFNIGYQYDVYQDRQEDDKYLSWCRDWLGEVIRLLKPELLQRQGPHDG